MKVLDSGQPLVSPYYCFLEWRIEGARAAPGQTGLGVHWECQLLPVEHTGHGPVLSARHQ